MLGFLGEETVVGRPWPNVTFSVHATLAGQILLLRPADSLRMLLSGVELACVEPNRPSIPVPISGHYAAIDIVICVDRLKVLLLKLSKSIDS
jgi:hypothetical protein